MGGATVVHTDPVTGETHTHGPTSAKIVGLGTVTVGGATFMVDRDGQVESGKDTEFGVEQVSEGAKVKPTGAWLAFADGSKLCDPEKGHGHDDHFHFNLCPLDPVRNKVVKFVLQVGAEEASVDVAPGAAPCNDGILSVFTSASAESPSKKQQLEGGASNAVGWRGFLELKLHGDAGDLELWLYTSAGKQTAWMSHTEKPKPFDVPKETVITLTFPSHKDKRLELRVRNGDKNEDETGTPNMRESGTNYFIFPGESGQDPEWIKGEKWRGSVMVSFNVGDKSYACDPFVLVPHEAL